MKLKHIHLPPLTPYPLASALQESMRRVLLSSKDSSSHQTSPSSSSPPPPPFLISFTPPPTYTLGRRQTSPLSDAATSRLTAPLSTALGTFSPVIIPSPRGGLTTYHGPGQVVLWPVIDIHSSPGRGGYNRFSVRDYACALEKTTISTLERKFGLQGFTTDDPGVWLKSGQDGKERKIAALGVHLRRHVTSLGTAVNLDFPRDGDEGTDPWQRFVPCGLEGREVTSVGREVEGASAGEILDGAGFAREWAGEFARRIGVQGAEEVDVDGLDKLGVKWEGVLEEVDAPVKQSWRGVEADEIEEKGGLGNS